MRMLAVAVFAVVLAVAVSLSALAGPVAPEITLPAAGRVILPGHVYTTELTLTNHRDVTQAVAVHFIKDGVAMPFAVLSLGPKRTLFADSWFGTYTTGNAFGVGALRFVALTQGYVDGDPVGDEPGEVEQYFDPAGLLEAKAFVIHERGPFALHGSSRQEIEAIPASEYRSKQNIFLGVVHAPPTYTNVGIVNLHPTETVTFSVQYQYLEPVQVTVGPLSSVQVRVTGGRSPIEEGNGGRYVVVTPEWANDGTGRTTPWVAYASTIDGLTGDAFSGLRVPPDTEIKR